jgi:hypothetical protein
LSQLRLRPSHSASTWGRLGRASQAAGSGTGTKEGRAARAWARPDGTRGLRDSEVRGPAANLNLKLTCKRGPLASSSSSRRRARALALAGACQWPPAPRPLAGPARDLAGRSPSPPRRRPRPPGRARVYRRRRQPQQPEPRHGMPTRHSSHPRLPVAMPPAGQPEAAHSRRPRPKRRTPGPGRTCPAVFPCPGLRAALSRCGGGAITMISCAQAGRHVAVGSDSNASGRMRCLTWSQVRSGLGVGPGSAAPSPSRLGTGTLKWRHDAPLREWTPMSDSGEPSESSCPFRLKAPRDQLERPGSVARWQRHLKCSFQMPVRQSHLQLPA